MAAVPKKLEPGDPCPNCKEGTIQVLNTFVTGGTRCRYLGCRSCGHRPEENKRTLPEAFAPRRSRFKS